jgi:hypothetical protein
MKTFNFEEDTMASRIISALFAVVVVVLVPGRALAQAPATKPAAGVPRTPDGTPDLQGFWDFRTLTPLERPGSQANKPFLSVEEAKALQARRPSVRTTISGLTAAR